MSNLTMWKHKHLVSIEHLTAEEIQGIFSIAQQLKAHIEKGIDLFHILQGKTVVNLFVEASTRTRLSFEMAAKRLGAGVVLFSEDTSSLVKGETLRDTALNIQALEAHMLVLRHRAPGAALYLTNVLDIPVINAGDGAHEHPTQALLDVFTLNQVWEGNFKNKKVTILGDALFSRVARSNIYALQRLGVEVTLAGPSTLVPQTFKQLGVSVCYDLKKALEDADAVMLLRIQHERQTAAYFPSLGEYTRLFGLNQYRSSWLKPNVFIMHPGPINRGVEIDSHLADSPRSLILKQVQNGLAVRMAVLYLCHAVQVQQQSVPFLIS
jgi:aspartate carbamoyltransferase catalytic subunit